MKNIFEQDDSVFFEPEEMILDKARKKTSLQEFINVQTEMDTTNHLFNGPQTLPTVLYAYPQSLA